MDKCWLIQTYLFVVLYHPLHQNQQQVPYDHDHIQKIYSVNFVNETFLVAKALHKSVVDDGDWQTHVVVVVVVVVVVRVDVLLLVLLSSPRHTLEYVYVHRRLFEDLDSVEKS